MTDNTNLVIDTYMFLKNYTRKDGTRQVIIRVKIGYSQFGRKVITNEHDIKMLTADGRQFYLTKKEFANRSNNNELMQRFYELDSIIRKQILKNKQGELAIKTTDLTKNLYDSKHIAKSELAEELVEDEFLKKIDAPAIPKEAYDKLITEDFRDADTNEAVSLEDLEGVAIAKAAKHYEEQDQQEIDQMSFNEKYRKGHFDHNNIFEVLGFCWSENPNTGEPYISAPYKALILRLYDYKANMNPSTKIEDFNYGWVTDFLTFLGRKGYAEVKFHNYDPFSLNKPELQAKLKNAKRVNYDIQSFKKIVKHLKRYIEILQGKFLLPHNINTKAIKATDFIARSQREETHTRQDHTLTIKEFNKLASTDFEDKELNLARDMFIISVLGGGLRTSELYDQNLFIQDNHIHIYRGKNKKLSKNPIVFPELQVVVDRHKGIPELLNKQQYRDALKKIAKVLEFNRIIPIKITKMYSDHKIINQKVRELFNHYFARKTCVNILEHYGLTKEEIANFTDHEDYKTLKYYKGPMDVDKKEHLLTSKLKTAGVL